MPQSLFEISKNLLMQDIETIYTLIKQSSQKDARIFIMSVLPYLTACVAGTIDFMEEHQVDCSALTIKRNYPHVLTKTRNKIKIYRERTNKNMTEIDTIRDGQNEEFANMLRFPILKQLGLNYDLGTYRLGGQIIGNTFLYKWFFDEIEKIQTENPQLEYGKTLGEAVAFTRKIWHTNYSIKGDFDFGTIEHTDYNITLRASKVFASSLDKGQCLFLFNIMCQVNFALYYMDRILSAENSLSIRIKYLTYYFSCSSIRALENYCSQNRTAKFPLDSSTMKNISCLLNEDFCNCMRHYEIRDRNILGATITHNDEMGALIAFYHGCSKTEFIDKLNDHLEAISNHIKKSIMA